MRQFREASFDTLNYIFLAIIGFATLYPFINLLAVSFNDPLDTMRGEVYFWPNQFTLDNFKVIFQEDALYMATLRSVLRTVVGTLLSVACTTMLAYTLSRREFFLRKSINLLMIISMYVSGGIIPSYLLIKGLSLTNSFWVYIIPGLISVFNVIIVRTAIEQLPEGLIESARLDGASEFQVLFRVVIPCSLPVLATIVLFTSVGHWNSWFDNYLYNTRDNLNLLQFELMKVLLQSTSQMVNNASSTGYIDNETVKNITPEAIRATMTVVVTFPILLVYPFLQKYFIKGVLIGAVKE
ncbi:carbohydrate ABC transporter permease [Paenibacillus sp. LHD-38]|uniref:carbohydrate ABC transporter permease n=1 Tax=Paenibacillus sp. LHD-38 TaxID=3072143 RepID=UPI00280F472D|nr:carbohydrate ABC transporter permease [Paenibacillus sp. LHD-38]MDQ8739001.1 carbohydrate ABC transporter permease [Paenibacillus sp. LHD-38]